jgi:DNA-binding Lrp family transcriptional regulator
VCVTNSLSVDELDTQLVQALQLDGRAPFSTIADVVGVSADTVARRYRRLRASAGLRIVGRPGSDGPHAGARWLARIRCAPDAAPTTAAALARRPDTSFIMVVSGCSEVVCVVDSADEAGGASLLRPLPGAQAVVSVTVHRLLRTVYGGPDGWYSKIDALGADQVSALRPPVPPPRAGGSPRGFDASDRALLTELGRDGRAGHTALGASARLSEPSVRRRLGRLRATGAVYFDLQLDPGLMGFRTVALLWLTVTPAALEPVGAALAAHPEVAFVAATTGPSNLVAAVICRSADNFYGYLAHRIAAIDGILQVETATALRLVKQLR